MAQAALALNGDSVKNIIICLLSSLMLAGCVNTHQPVRNGFVQIKFDIDENGQPLNLRVVESYPVGYFDEASINAISKQKYEPKVVNGTPVKLLNQKVRFLFDVTE